MLFIGMGDFFPYAEIKIASTLHVNFPDAASSALIRTAWATARLIVCQNQETSGPSKCNPIYILSRLHYSGNVWLPPVNDLGSFLKKISQAILSRSWDPWLTLISNGKHPLPALPCLLGNRVWCCVQSWYKVWSWRIVFIPLNIW